MKTEITNIARCLKGRAAKAFILLMITASITRGQDSTMLRRDITGFRGSIWDSSVEEVKQREARGYADSLEISGMIFLIFSGDVLERKANIYYGFEDGKLTTGYYSFQEDYTSIPERYFTDYDLFKSAISSQYGGPLTDEWLSAQRADADVYKLNPGLAAAALTIGSLSRKSRWLSSQAEITLILKGGSGVKTIVCYCKGTCHDMEDAYKNVTQLENY